jgi:hypothetical protein
MPCNKNTNTGLAFLMPNQPGSALCGVLAFLVYVCAATLLNDPPVLGDAGNAIYLDGEAWVLRSIDGEVKVSALVPGDLLTDLQRAGLIGDPMLNVNFRDQTSA